MFCKQKYIPIPSTLTLWLTYLVFQWLVNYFSRLTTEQSMACMQEMLRGNIRQNLQVVIQIATKYSDILGPLKLIEIFESFKSFGGINAATCLFFCSQISLGLYYYYLGSIVNLSTDPEVHFKCFFPSFPFFNLLLKQDAAAVATLAVTTTLCCKATARR